MRRSCLVAALMVALAAPACAASASAALDELKKSFTVDGKPIPPQVFGDFGDSDMADSGSIRVTIDLLAAIGSNLYFGDIQTGQTGWVAQKKVTAGPDSLTEEMDYKFIGTTKNGLLVVVASYSGGGSGTFYSLHLLDAALARAFDNDGKLYDRLNLTVLRTMALGDRWDGTVKIAGNTVTIETSQAGPADTSGKTTTQHFEAARPN